MALHRLLLLTFLILLLSSLCSVDAASNDDNDDDDDGPRKTLIKEDTTWNAQTLPSSESMTVGGEATLVLTGPVVLFPDVHLTVEGEESQPITIFFTTADSVIDLHDGASVELRHVNFVGHPQNETSTPSVGWGVRTIGTSASDYPRHPTILAHHFHCEGLYACIDGFGAASVEINASSFRVRTSSFSVVSRSKAVGLHTGSIDNSYFETVMSIGVAVANGRLDVSNCTFRGLGTASNAVICTDDAQCSVKQSSFVGYQTFAEPRLVSYDYHHEVGLAISGVRVKARHPFASRCDVSGSVFLGNHIGVHCLRGTISHSLFKRNTIAVRGVGYSGVVTVQSSWAVENSIAFQRLQRTMDVAICRNLVGYWIESELPDYQELQGPHVKITLKDNVVGTRGYGLEKSSGINIFRSEIYHIDYGDKSTWDLQHGAYWGGVQDKDLIRQRIRDGLSGGGPGLVIFDTDQMEPTVHPTFTAVDDDCQPLPSHTKMVEDLHDDVPIPNAPEQGFFPHEIAAFNYSAYLRGFAASAGSNDKDDYGSGGSSSLPCSEEDDASATFKIHEVIVRTETCEWLARDDDRKRKSYCTSPSSNAADRCPYVCNSCSADREGVARPGIVTATSEVENGSGDSFAKMPKTETVASCSCGDSDLSDRNTTDHVTKESSSLSSSSNPHGEGFWVSRSMTVALFLYAVVLHIALLVRGCWMLYAWRLQSKVHHHYRQKVPTTENEAAAQGEIL